MMKGLVKVANINNKRALTYAYEIYNALSLQYCAGSYRNYKPCVGSKSKAGDKLTK